MDKRFYCEYGMIIDKNKIGVEEDTTIFDEEYDGIEKFCNLLNQFYSHITDLEAKLAESEKLIEFYVNSGKELCDEINKINHRSMIKSNEIDQLKQQLAEERKRVIQEIREPIIKSLENGVVRKDPKSSNRNLRDIILFQVLDILDQVERG